MLLRILKQLRPCLIELMWLEHKPVSLNSLVQDKIKQYFDRAQPSPNTSKNERNLPCRQDVLAKSHCQIRLYDNTSTTKVDSTVHTARIL